MFFRFKPIDPIRIAKDAFYKNRLQNSRYKRRNIKEKKRNGEKRSDQEYPNERRIINERPAREDILKHFSKYISSLLRKILILRNYQLNKERWIDSFPRLPQPSLQKKIDGRLLCRRSFILFFSGIRRVLRLNVSDIFRNVVLDRVPLHLLEQGNQRNGNVRKHKQRECKRIKNLLDRRTVDLLPFRDRRNKSNEEHRQIELRHGRDQGGYRQGHHIGTVRLTDGNDQRGHVCNAASKGDEQGREDRHRQIKAGKAEIADPIGDQFSAVFAENLIKALCPAHTLNPGLLEGDGLFVKEFGVGKADLSSRNGTVHGKFDILRQQGVMPAVRLFEYG